MATVNKDFLVKNGIQVGGNASVTGSLTAAGLSYPVSDGDPYMAVVTDGFGNLSFNNVDTVESDVTNNTGSLIPKGTPVYQTGAAGNTLTIAPSDASNAATMPAIGVAASDIADGDTGRVIHFGYIHGVDTSAFSEGDRIYVADGGGYQVGRPTGEGNVVQFLGVVTKVHATNGSGVVFGGGRSMDVPNLNDGNIFIGDSTNTAVTATLDTDITPEGSTNLYFTDQRAVDAVEAHPHLTIDGGTLYVDTDSNRIGINDTSPQEALDVNGNVNVQGGITSTGSNMLGYGTNLDQGIGRLSINYLGSGEPILASQGSSINFGSNLALYGTNTIFKTASNPNHLNIAQDRVGYDINFQTSPVTNGVRATAMTIEGTGNVGIGTSAPSGLLHVQGVDNTTSTVFRAGEHHLRGTGNGNDEFRVVVSQTDGMILGSNGGLSLNYNGTYLTLGSVDNTGATDTIRYAGPIMKLVNDNQAVGVTDSLYIVDNKTNYARGASIKIESTSNTAAAYTQYGLDVDVTNTTGDAYAVYSRAGLNYFADAVGIGTANPVSQLEVHTGSSAAYFTRSAGDNGTLAAATAIANDSTKAIIAASGERLAFRVGAVGTGATNQGERLSIIGSNGYVGVGTASPSSRLEVVDTFAVTGLQPRIRLKETDTTNNDKEMLVSNGSFYIRQLNDDNTNGINLLTLNSAGDITVTGSINGSTWSHTATSFWKNTQQTDRTLRFGTFSDDSASYFGPLNDVNSDELVDLGTSDGRWRNLNMAGTANIGGSAYIGGDVGIGTTTPATSLEVIGDIRLKNAETNANYSNIDASEALLTFETYTVNAAAYPADIVLKPAGTEVLRATDDGKVGIGTSTPDNRFHVVAGADGEVAQFTGAIETRGLSIRVNTAVDASAETILNAQSGGTDARIGLATDGATRLYINKDGNVGIGTTAPGAKLHIDNVIQSNDSVDYPVIISQSDPSNSLNQVGGSGVGILFKAATNSTAEIGASIAAVKPGGSDDDTTTDLAFYVSQNDTTLDEAVRISNTGRVGIGTTSPVEKLYVNSTSGDARIGLNAPTGSDTEIKFSNNGTVEYTIGHDDATDNFVIGTTNVDADLVSVTKSGNVGIGTGSPQNKLSVVSNGTAPQTGFDAQLVASGSSGNYCTLSLVGGNAGQARIIFGDSDNTASGRLVFDNTDDSMQFQTAYNERLRIDSSGHVTPGANATQDLGSASLAWRNIYTNDLHLSNEGHEEGNSVDGTKGNWTIQEGEDHLYIINNKNGKKYRFALEEIE